MTLRKVLTIAFIAGVLGAQIYALIPWTPGEWYWPFMEYPMYSAARSADDVIEDRRVVAVGPGGEEELDHRDLRAKVFLFRSMLARAFPGPEGPEPEDDTRRDAERWLSRRLSLHYPGRFERLEIHSLRYVPTPDGFRPDPAGRRRIGVLQLEPAAAEKGR